MRVSKFISRQHVFTDIDSEQRDDVIRVAVDRLVETGAVPAKSVRTIVKGILDREELGSTGIGRGIAIPHVKTRVVTEPIVAYVHLGTAIDYGATDGQPVHSMFFVVSPFKASDDHVAILRWISKIARTEYYSQILKNTTDADSLHQLFGEIDEQS
jgi:nitrogen PTS system EIIA component